MAIRPRGRKEKKLNDFAERDPAKADALHRLRVEHEDHIRQIEGAQPERAGTPLRLFSSEYERLSREALTVERKTIVKLRNQEVINDEVLRRILRDIDLAEARWGHRHQPRANGKNRKTCRFIFPQPTKPMHVIDP